MLGPRRSWCWQAFSAIREATRLVPESDKVGALRSREAVVLLTGGAGAGVAVLRVLVHGEGEGSKEAWLVPQPARGVRVFGFVL